MKASILVSLMLGASLTYANEPTAAQEASKGVSADTSMSWLKNGNKRFLTHTVRKDGQAEKDVTRLSTGQTPHAIVLSCSDSRVPPEVVFDQKLGEIFVVRTAGESLDDNVVGSIEYAVEHLGSQLIVVMGHTSCGAVKAALGSLDGSSVGTPALDGLVKDMHPRLASYKGHKPSANVEEESWANTQGVANDLLKRSALLKKKVDAGTLKVVPSLYNLNSGIVEFNHQHETVPTRSAASIAH
jgi:carbonic anhydrase